MWNYGTRAHLSHTHYSSLSARLALLSKKEMPVSCGATLAAMRRLTQEIALGRAVRLRRLRTTSSIGSLLHYCSRQHLTEDVCSLGERYGLRIIPGKNAFLVLPNYISRSTAVGAILHAGGPTYSPRVPWILPEENESVAHSKDFVLAIGQDEKLLRRLGELDNAETCSTGTGGTDARWRIPCEEVVGILEQLVAVQAASLNAPSRSP